MSETSKKLLVVVNPTAGKMNVKGGMFEIIKTFSDNDYFPTVVMTKEAGDAARLVEENVKDYDRVVCCGGDGTLNETIRGMLTSGVSVPIGYIPCGTTNDTANTLHLPKQVAKAAQVVVNGTPVYHDIGSFGQGMCFSYIASFGIFTKTSYSAPQKVKNLLGHFAYVLEGVKELGDIKSYKAKFTFDGNVIEDEFLYASVSNTVSFAGLFSLPKNDVSLNDGKFELLLIKRPKNLLEVNSIILNLSVQNYTDDKNIMLFHTDNVTVEPCEDITWTVDGECSGPVGEVNIRCISDNIKIIQPNK